MQVTYPPLNVLKPVADGVWIVDSGPLRTMGVPFPLRMTVIRLADGGLWVHSPTPYDDALRREMEQVGPIRHLIAPSFSHWMYVAAWQKACPTAFTWAAPRLRERRQVRNSGVRFDRELTTASPSDWSDEIEQTVVPGGLEFREVDFFHVPSRTLVLVDLVLNIEPARLPPPLRPIVRLLGVMAPEGRAPAHLRWIIGLRRRDAAEAAARIVAWEPERVIFAHGAWWEKNARTELRRSLRWLLA
jgi:hypothetical protein